MPLGGRDRSYTVAFLTRVVNSSQDSRRQVAGLKVGGNIEGSFLDSELGGELAHLDVVREGDDGTSDDNREDYGVQSLADNEVAPSDDGSDLVVIGGRMHAHGSVQAS